MLIDTHAHLYWDNFKPDFDAMIQRTADAGLNSIINIGVDIEKSKEALGQALNINLPSGLSVYSSIGIHPHESVKYAPLQISSGRGTNAERLTEDMEELEKIYLSNPQKVVAVGECGLDFFFDPSFAETSEGKSPDISEIKILQKKLFQAHIEMAKKLKLPLIIHCRDDRSKNPQNSECWDEVITMVGNHPTILHCYSGLPHTTNSILPITNLLVSFAGNITYPKNEYLREAVKLLPIGKILLETDSPFLSPQSKRGQRNEPSAVKEIAQLIADIKRLTFEEVSKETTKNAQRIFNL